MRIWYPYIVSTDYDSQNQQDDEVPVGPLGMGEGNEMTDKRGCVDSEYTIEEPELLWLENDEDKCQGVDCYECLIEQPRADIVLMGFVGEMEHSRHGEQNDERKGYQLVGRQNAEVGYAPA